ncbi:zincin-like metallopeptidase domain-containing protein [uncultured Agrobacterium sp.]|uniref:ArdC family protein n=1 Tax=uncultured Agrobacterium sp. TaxID=157277 RepID=UPI0025E7051F|nr:zincin-like metallopeptidase domain-containing protein [uncultured Agrobacterium sp.]
MKDYRQSLYAEVTQRIVAELEAGRLPWVQPWDASRCVCSMPSNAVSGRGYSGINVLILWAAGVEQGFTSQRWLTYRQAEQAGGHVRRGEKGTVICYADRFTPRDEADKAQSEDREARTVAFLKRFTVFNLDQCEGLPEALKSLQVSADPIVAVEAVDAIIRASGADVRIGGGEAYYAPAQDYVAVPPQAAFHEPINWYRTALHELGHWTGHTSRLGRDQSGKFGTAAYAREELVAEMASAFACASLGIVPTVRHADYVGAWLQVLHADEKAIFRAASAASKAADFLLSCGEAQA